jgi:hypothetical protein
MLTPGLLRSLRINASIKAHPATTMQGVRSEPVHQFNLKVAPIDSLDPNLAERFRIEAPLHSKQTYAYTSQVIKTGMYLSVAGKDYPIRGLATYPDDDGNIFYQMVLEEIVVT